MSDADRVTIQNAFRQTINHPFLIEILFGDHSYGFKLMRHDSVAVAAAAAAAAGGGGGGGGGGGAADIII